MTPEGKVKKRVQEVLSEFGAYWFMPVQTGLGAPGLDFHCCVRGLAFFIETKAGNKQPTPRQRNTIRKIQLSGGRCFVINDVEGMESLRLWLTEVCDVGIS